MVTANFVISEDEFDVLYTLAGLYGDDLGYVKEYEVEIYARDLGAIQPVDDPLVPGDEYYVATQRNNYLVAIEMLKRVKQRNRPDAAIYQEQINDLSFKLDLMDDGPTTPTPSGEGINIAEVDARVRRLVDDWAEAGNTDLIPRDKIPDELPEFPPEGERDKKVAKFEGDTLGWEVDAGDTGGARDQTARDAATNAQETADANKLAIDTLESTGTEVSGAIGVVPKNIDAIADIDGDYILAVNDLNIEYLNSKNVDQYEIWVKEESIHTSTGTWTPVSDFQVPFNVSTTEETGIGLVGTDRIVPIRLVFRASGTFVDWVATYLTIGDGGGSGDVTTDQFNAEVALREAGDSPDITNIASAAALTSALSSQATNNNPVWLWVQLAANTGSFTHSGTTYDHGDLLYVPPNSTDIERGPRIVNYDSLHFNIVTQNANQVAFQIQFNKQPNSHHSTWFIATEDFTATVTNVGNFTVKTGDVWHAPPFSRSPSKLFNIAPSAPAPTSSTEFVKQLQVVPAGVENLAALIANPLTVVFGEARNVPSGTRKMALFVQASDRSTSSEVGKFSWDYRNRHNALGEVITLPTIRQVDLNATGIRSSDKAVNLAISFLDASDVVLGDKEVPFVVGIGSQFATPSGELADKSVTTAKLADRAVTGDKLARNTVAGDNLTPRVQTALLQMRTDPVRESAGGAYTIAFGDAGLLGGSLFIQIRMNGRLVGAREAWTQQATLTRTPNAADLIEINRVSTTSVIITADWYSQLSGGNLVAGANYEVAIVPAVSDWALDGNKDAIPTDKLANAGTIASPALVVTNIASFDGTQNRFEDSSGNEVTIPNGALVFLTQAIYDAAVADAQFTPNANAVFFTSS